MTSDTVYQTSIHRIVVPKTGLQEGAVAPTQKLLLGSRRFSKVWYVIHSIPEQATEWLPAFVLSSEKQMPWGRSLQGCLWEFTGAMSGRLRKEELTVAEQHQPGCRADRQEASDGSVAWRLLGREPRHHSSIRRVGSLHPAGTARQHPILFPAGTLGEPLWVPKVHLLRL